MRADQQPDNVVGALLAGIFTDDRVRDLTLPLAEELPCTWPGRMPFRVTVCRWFASRPAASQWNEERS